MGQMQSFTIAQDFCPSSLGRTDHAVLKFGDTRWVRSRKGNVRQSPCNDFMELHDWDEDHDEHQSLLHSMTKTITRVMESNVFKSALDLIPNGTVPAGSVVKALAAVVVLGMVRLLRASRLC
jgi:hypothetical protein